MPFHIQKNQRYPRRLYPQLAQTGALLPYHTFGCIRKGNLRKLLHHTALFGTEYLLGDRSRSAVGVGVGVGIFRPGAELESESLKIRRLRSPAPKYTKGPLIRIQGPLDRHKALPEQHRALSGRRNVLLGRLRASVD